MDVILYNLVNSEWFWIFVAVWVILGVMWTARLAVLMERLRFLVTMPPISKDAPDDYPQNQNPPKDFFYPRRLFVDLARLLERVAELVRGQHDIVWNVDHKMRTLTFFMLFLAICAFIFADYVAVANGLSAIFDVDLLLTPFVVASYGLAVSIATLLSFIVGFFVFIQALVHEPLMLFKAGSNSAKIKQLVSVVVSLVALFVGSLIGIERLIALGYLSPNSTIDWLAQFGVHVLILVNGTLSAGLIAEESLYGLVVLGFVIGWIVIIVGGAGRHLFDLVIRLVIGLLDLLLYFVFTPIFGLAEIVKLGIGSLWPGPPKSP